MFAGHIGAALAIGRAERRINPGVLVFSALFLDLVLWLLVLAGWESVTIPADYATGHQLSFVFPFSHGLVAAASWSVLAGAGTFLYYRRIRALRLRAASLVALAVFSHWVLDLLVHVPELPLMGEHSPKVGYGLWQNMPWALGIEALITVVGLCLFLSGSKYSRKRRISLAALCLSLIIFTVAGMTMAPPPPSARAVAASSLVTLVLVCLLTAWIGRTTSEGP